tara:strand:- start:126 stop:281 length:156 start_codon:yes stop_codon:yes gene_type:complete
MHQKRPNDQRADDLVWGHISERKFYRNWIEMKSATGLKDDDKFVIHMLRQT